MEDQFRKWKAWFLKTKFKEEIDTKGCIRFATISSTFWISSIAFQRVAGAVTVHSGRSGVVQMFAGGVGAGASTALSLMTNNALNNDRFVVDKFSLEYDRQTIRNIYLSVVCFTVLEQLPIPFVLPFATVLPSSLLDKGVFARAWGSVPATAVAATDSERRVTQKLGRWRGCHHCGGRMRQLLQPKGVALIGGMGYIADHMPPTKIAKERSDAWWRKLLRITVSQRLYPQCKSCFSQQGKAVRSGTHTLVYHFGLRPCHLASAVAVLLCTSASTREMNGYFLQLENALIKTYRSLSKTFIWK